MQRKVPKRARSRHAANTILLSLEIASTWRQSRAPHVIMFMGTLITQDYIIEFKSSPDLPEPVHNISPVGLRYDLTAEVGDGREVHTDGNLQH